LRSDDLQYGGRAEVKLIQQEGVGVDCLQPELAERGSGEIVRVGGDDGLRASPDRRRDNVPVILVWQGDSGLQPFPAGNQGIIKRCVHVSEALVHVDPWMDLLDGLPRFGQDAL
jgi:hypothetical protein